MSDTALRPAVPGVAAGAGPVRLPSPGTRRAFRHAVDRLARTGATADSIVAGPHHRLPPDLVRQLTALLGAPAGWNGYRVLRGLFADLGEPGPTPLHWSEPTGPADLPHELALALVGRLLGEVFGWANQQDGRLVHNILPSPGQETRQVGASSTLALAWHTEDGFHPERADFLLLACLRNPGGTGTRLASIRDIELGGADAALLGRPQLVIDPDDSYEPDPREGEHALGIRTVWGTGSARCVRYDPAYTRLLTPDPDFARAYARLGPAFERHAVEVPLEPGDLLLVDNDVMVHGRSAFPPRYDGSDRWLKRVLVRSTGTGRPNRPAQERLEHGFGQHRVRPATADARRTMHDA
ncbi:TauD/TfdA family dioxygenase [Streptomyces sp. NPDC059900]|uniref:TauD/TfdA family dioxygenase n=1 Tax=Streptomyces sp. NPDC059900 TaxID=3155816 RepID=UPI00341F133C